MNLRLNSWCGFQCDMATKVRYSCTALHACALFAVRLDFTAHRQCTMLSVQGKNTVWALNIRTLCTLHRLVALTNDVLYFTGWLHLKYLARAHTMTSSRFTMVLYLPLWSRSEKVRLPNIYWSYGTHRLGIGRMRMWNWLRSVTPLGTHYVSKEPAINTLRDNHLCNMCSYLKIANRNLVLRHTQLLWHSRRRVLADSESTPINDTSLDYNTTPKEHTQDTLTHPLTVHRQIWLSTRS